MQRSTVIFILLWLGLSLSFAWAYVAILKPAYYSTVEACDHAAIHLSINGAFHVQELENGTVVPTITIIGPDPDQSTLKHENCHFIQWKQNRIFPSCTPAYGRLFNEMEANFCEKLPTQIYEMVYGKLPQ